MKSVIIILALILFVPTVEARSKTERFKPTREVVKKSHFGKKFEPFKWIKGFKKKPSVVKPARVTRAQPRVRPQIARVTFWDPSQDKWGSRVACPDTHRAREGVTVAAHSTIPFGTVVQIPGLKGIVGNGQFEVQDRGSAVNKRTAETRYGKSAEVIDVYVTSRYKRQKLMKQVPDYLEVTIM